jgi:DNA replication protein DnaC
LGVIIKTQFSPDALVLKRVFGVPQNCRRQSRPICDSEPPCLNRVPTCTENEATPIRAFATLDFIPKAENIVFVGETGVGKTGLACGLLLKAVQNGYRALFFKAQDLFDEMYASLADRSTRRLLKSLSKIDLLLIDELGYINAKTEQTNIFFKLMEERHHRRPTIITTNLAYPEWQGFLGNRPLTDALLSRLHERCHTVKIDGPCLRAQQG